MRDTVTTERLKEMLDYDHETGIFRWKIRPAWNSRRQIGDVAGRVAMIHGRPYRYIGVDKHSYAAQRLAWLWMTGQWPKGQVTFENGDTLDCRFANLIDKPVVAVNAGFKKRDNPAAYQRANRKVRSYREYDLKRDFGITAAEYNTLYVEQKGVCAICACAETDTRNGKLKWLAVDHDHATGATRGLLCQACNTAIGKMADDPTRLRRAADYLERHALPANVVPLRKG